MLGCLWRYGRSRICFSNTAARKIGGDVCTLRSVGGNSQSTVNFTARLKLLLFIALKQANRLECDLARDGYTPAVRHRSQIHWNQVRKVRGVCAGFRVVLRQRPLELGKLIQRLSDFGLLLTLEQGVAAAVVHRGKNKRHSECYAHNDNN